VNNTREDRLGESEAILFGTGFGTGFGTVSDLFAGSGGMYVVGYDRGTIYRVTTGSGTASGAGWARANAAVPEPMALALLSPLVLAIRRVRSPLPPGEG